MQKGTMGLKAPSLGGQRMRGAASSIGGASTSGAPPSINTGALGRKVIGMLRNRRLSNRTRARKM